MKTENEIKALPLEDLQKLVVELRAVKTGDKAYPNAKAIITLATSLKKWKEPEKVEVKNIAGHVVSVDGVDIAADATGKVFPWQLGALARFLEPIAKTTALMLFVCLLALGFTAGAQTQSTALGSPGSYHVYYIAGLNGSVTNMGTNSFTTGVITTNTTIVPNWNYTNGVAYNVPTTNSTYTTNFPGIISLVNVDLADIQWTFQLNNTGSSTATLTADYSDDMINWRLSALTMTQTANGTTAVTTNTTLSTFGPGWLRFNSLSYPSATLIQTNVLEVAVKPSRTGPF